MLVKKFTLPVEVRENKLVLELVKYTNQQYFRNKLGRKQETEVHAIKKFIEYTLAKPEVATIENHCCIRPAFKDYLLSVVSPSTTNAYINHIQLIFENRYQNLDESVPIEHCLLLKNIQSTFKTSKFIPTNQTNSLWDLIEKPKYDDHEYLLSVGKCSIWMFNTMGKIRKQIVEDNNLSINDINPEYYPKKEFYKLDKGSDEYLKQREGRLKYSVFVGGVISTALNNNNDYLLELFYLSVSSLCLDVLENGLPSKKVIKEEILAILEPITNSSNLYTKYYDCKHLLDDKQAVIKNEYLSPHLKKKLKVERFMNFPLECIFGEYTKAEINALHIILGYHRVQVSGIDTLKVSNVVISA
jgi:predicted nucleic acid-binding Zn finger protein